jgi:hypothetical protein
MSLLYPTIISDDIFIFLQDPQSSRFGLIIVLVLQLRLLNTLWSGFALLKDLNDFDYFGQLCLEVLYRPRVLSISYEVSKDDLEVPQVCAFNISILYVQLYIV